jgi:hypothetical protein
MLALVGPIAEKPDRPRASALNTSCSNARCTCGVLQRQFAQNIGRAPGFGKVD